MISFTLVIAFGVILIGAVLVGVVVVVAISSPLRVFQNGL
jgi:hypothetical protein